VTIFLYLSEYHCLDCGHDFGKLGDGDLHCPRCGSDALQRNPFLLGQASAEGLTEEDYFSCYTKI